MCGGIATVDPRVAALPMTASQINSEINGGAVKRSHRSSERKRAAWKLPKKRRKNCSLRPARQLAVCASSAGGSALHVLPKEVVEGWGGDTVGPLLPVEAIYCTYPMS